MNTEDIARLGFREGQKVTACTAADDGALREVHGLSIKAYSIPRGAVGGNFPELVARGASVPVAWLL